MSYYWWLMCSAYCGMAYIHAWILLRKVEPSWSGVAIHLGFALVAFLLGIRSARRLADHA